MFDGFVKGGDAGSFEIDEEEEGLAGVDFKDTIVRVVGKIIFDGVHNLEDLLERVDIEAVECPLASKRRPVMSHVQLVVNEPDICLGRNTSVLDTFIRILAWVSFAVHL